MTKDAEGLALDSNVGLNVGLEDVNTTTVSVERIIGLDDGCPIVGALTGGLKLSSPPAPHSNGSWLMPVKVLSRHYGYCT